MPGESARAENGACLGILMLETRFPRILGDVGNPNTWPFPVKIRIVPDASPQRVVREGAAGLLDAFCETAAELVAEGVDGIGTTCGFLSLFQDDIAARCSVPVATSSLLQAAFIQRLLGPRKRVGILTISAGSLTEAHMIAAGVPPGTPVLGTEGGREFTRAILNDEPDLDIDLARQDILDAGAELLAVHPDVGAILLECTNMAPYSKSLQVATGLPVFDIYTFLTWFQSALSPRDFTADAPTPR